MKWGCFCKQKWKMGVFCNKVDLSSTQDALCTVSVFFYFFYFILQRTPTAYGPVSLLALGAIFAASLYDDKHGVLAGECAGYSWPVISVCTLPIMRKHRAI